MSTSYPSNLTDAQWACLQRYLPTVSKRGRPPIHPLRTIFDALFYVLRTGCPWRYLPANFPRLSNGVLPLSPFARSPAPGAGLLMVLREAERERVGRNTQRSRAIMDAASASKRLRRMPGSVARDAHTCVKGRKRHILVDRLGLHLAVYVTPADLHDGKGARCLLAGLASLYSRLKKIWADAAYRGQGLAVWY
jgi:putative transposase